MLPTLFQEVQQLRAKIFTLENELDRLKVEASEKDQLTKQVTPLFLSLECLALWKGEGEFLLKVQGGSKSTLRCTINV